MLPELAREVRDHCLDVVGDRLRVVGVYDEDSFEDVYVRRDLQRVFDDQPLDSVHNPFLQAHRATQLLDRLYEPLQTSRALIQDYGRVVIFQFPGPNTTGIIVSIDSDDELVPVDLYADCLARVDALESTSP